ncbi:MAG: hypothetical protein WCN98_18045, partial [Verrucomicrobiaceae bacterium]
SMALHATAFLNGIPGPPVSLSFNITDANLNGIPDWWEAQYFDLSTAIAPDPNADTDGNGLSNMQEFIFGTNPRGVSHVVPTLQNPSQPVISWASISGRYYSLESSPDLIHWQQVTSLQPGTGDTMTFTEPQSVTGANFYRIRVTLP